MEETNQIVKSGLNGNPRHKLLIGTPTLGIVRMEWAHSRYGQTIPCNWSAGAATVGVGSLIPMHYLVADGQNLIVQEVIKKDYEWLLFWEDDVIAPTDAFMKINQYIKKGDVPIVSGLYFTKGSYSEPILYRGRGNSCFHKFIVGEKVWVDGVPTGFLLVHSSILKILWEESEEYTTLGGLTTRKVFETPSQIFYDPQKNESLIYAGTSDLVWCDRIMKKHVLKRAGWNEFDKRKYPFLCDSDIFCTHIDLNTGVKYPQNLPDSWISKMKSNFEEKVKKSVKDRQKRTGEEFAGV